MLQLCFVVINTTPNIDYCPCLVLQISIICGLYVKKRFSSPNGLFFCVNDNKKAIFVIAVHTVYILLYINLK